VSLATEMANKNKDTGEVTYKAYTIVKDECNRADTTLESLHALKTINPKATIAAGIASQLSDGASVSMLMEEVFIYMYNNNNNNNNDNNNINNNNNNIINNNNNNNINNER
jgi:hypothetical protein